MGTLVLTSIGLIKIEDINPNDEVWSYNEETKEKELKKVKQVFRNKTNEWLHLAILNEETKKEEKITCTKTHKIYIKDKGWIEAINILENDIVLMYNTEGKVINKDLQILDHYETTYNFEVEDNHNYYVSDECVLVHNDCVGAYDIEFESGRHYVGKGSKIRMDTSAKLKSTQYGDKIIKKTFYSAPNADIAFIQEHMLISKYNFDFSKGKYIGKLYNKINSPGRRLFELWFNEEVKYACS